MIFFFLVVCTHVWGQDKDEVSGMGKGEMIDSNNGESHSGDKKGQD